MMTLWIFLIRPGAGTKVPRTGLVAHRRVAASGIGQAAQSSPSRNICHMAGRWVWNYALRIGQIS